MQFFKFGAKSLLVFSIIFSASAFTPLSKANAQTTADGIPEAAAPIPLGKLGDLAKPLKYRIDLTILPEDLEFSGKTEIQTQINANSKFLFLHGKELSDVSVKAKIGDKSIDAKYTEVDDSGVARLDFASEIPAGIVNLVFDYKGKIGTQSIGLFRRKVEDEYYVYSQFQSIDARRAYPSFDEPAFKTPFDISITTHTGLVAVSNGAPLQKVKAGNLEKHSFATTDALPTYLTAFMLGPFAVKEGTIPPSPQRSKPIPLRIIGTKPNAEKMDFALAETPKIVALLEDYFNSPYPYSKLDQIGTPDFPGAMENAGAILYVEDLLFFDKDADNYQKREFGTIVSHEISHQWFGNLVTPKWWDDIWLNESFANWMGFKIASKWGPDLNIEADSSNAAFNAMTLDSLTNGRPIRHKIEKSSEADQAFDMITYNKGGQVVSMIANYLGDDAFRAGVRNHINKHKNGNATTEDFFTSLSSSVQDPKVLAALRSFVDLQGVPLIDLKRVSGGYMATQSRYTLYGAKPIAQNWTIPFCHRIDNQKKCVLLDEKPYKIEYNGAGTIFPNYNGVGYYRFKVPNEDWEKLVSQAAKLPAGEAQSLIDSMWAQFYSGELELPILIKLAKNLINHPNTDVVLESGYRLKNLQRAGLVPQSARTQYGKLFDILYMEKFKDIGTNITDDGYPNEKKQIGELRAGLADFLALEAQNENLANRILETSQRDSDSPDGELLLGLFPTAMRLMFKASDDEGLVAVYTYFKELTDKDQRELIGRFLNNGTLSGATYLLAQMNKSGLRNSEKLSVLEGIVEDPVTRDLALKWIVRNNSIFTSGTGVFGSDKITQFANYFCSLDAAQKFDETFRQRIKDAKRGEIEFDRALEVIRTCATLSQSKSAKIGADITKAVE